VYSQEDHRSGEKGSARMRKQIVPIILVGMFCVTILNNYILAPIGYLLHWDSTSLNPIYYIPVIGSYFCIILILWFDKKNAVDYNIDRASAYLLVIMGIFRSNVGVPSEIIYRIIIIILSIILLVAIRRGTSKLPSTNMRWIFVSLAVCSLVLPLSFIDSFSTSRYLAYTFTPGALLADISQKTFFNLSFVSLIEEVMYRAILWGYLIERGWSENKVFWVQVILFWVIHFYQLGTPITLFIVNPIGILIMSYLVRRSRQVFPAVVFHTAINAFLPYLALYFFSLFH
jgi:membrane protease YdiL (CAAX protease family)